MSFDFIILKDCIFFSNIQRYFLFFKNVLDTLSQLTIKMTMKKTASLKKELRPKAAQRPADTYSIISLPLKLTVSRQENSFNFLSTSSSLDSFFFSSNKLQIYKTQPKRTDMHKKATSLRNGIKSLQPGRDCEFDSLLWSQISEKEGHSVLTGDLI